MASYAVVTFKTDEGPMATVLAALETKLETLDSTTNPIRLIQALSVNNDVYVGVLIYDG